MGTAVNENVGSQQCGRDTHVVFGEVDIHTQSPDCRSVILIRDEHVLPPYASAYCLKRALWMSGLEPPALPPQAAGAGLSSNPMMRVLGYLLDARI